MPNYCVLRMQQPHILLCCYFTVIQAILVTGSISLAMLLQVLPSLPWIAAVRQDYQKISGGVTGNTLHGHIIRGLNDALQGFPGKIALPADISRYSPTCREL